MSQTLRAATACAGLSVLAVCGVAPSGAQTQADARPPCRHALVAMEQTVASAHAKSGDVSRFKLVDAVTAPDGTALPPGTTGYGMVANSAHAERGGPARHLPPGAGFFVLA